MRRAFVAGLGCLTLGLALLQATGIVALRPDQDGAVTWVEGVDEVQSRLGEWVLDAHLPPTAREAEDAEAHRQFVLTWVQPGLAGVHGDEVPGGRGRSVVEAQSHRTSLTGTPVRPVTPDAQDVRTGGPAVRPDGGDVQAVGACGPTARPGARHVWTGPTFRPAARGPWRSPRYPPRGP